MLQNFSKSNRYIQLLYITWNAYSREPMLTTQWNLNEYNIVSYKLIGM
jgi:hypothetical protein